MSKINERMEEATVRVEEIIWLPGAAIGGTLGEALRDALEDFYDGDRDNIFAAIPELKEFIDSGDGDEDWASNIFSQADGFLVQLARPVPSSFGSDSSSQTYSWGRYQTKWFHVNDVQEIVVIAEAFSESVVAKAYEKYLEKLSASQQATP